MHCLWSKAGPKRAIASVLLAASSELSLSLLDVAGEGDWEGERNLLL